MKHNRHQSTCVYMSILAVSDNLVLISALEGWMVRNFGLYGYSTMVCRIKIYWSRLCGLFGAYEIVLMTFDKFLAIKIPHRAMSVCTAKRARILSLCSLIFLALFTAPFAYFPKWNPTNKNCELYGLEGWYVTAYNYVHLVINPLIPIISLFIMNVVIINEIWKSSKMKTKKTKRSAETQISIMLVLVSILFVILLLPHEIKSMYFYYHAPESPKAFSTYIFVFALTIDLFRINYGVNFFLYLISGSKFRNDLNSLFCRTAKKFQNDSNRIVETPEMSQESRATSSGRF